MLPAFAARAGLSCLATLLGLCAAAGLLTVFSAPAHAQTQPPAGYAQLRIVGIKPTELHSGGTVTVLLDSASVQNTVDPTELVLYLDHVAFTGTKPLVGGERRHVLQYRIDRTTANRDAWVLLFRRHGRHTASVPVGVGMPAFGEVPAKDEAARLAKLSPFPGSLVAGAIVSILLALLMLLFGGRLLREHPAKADAHLLPYANLLSNASPPDPVVPPYSLGRVQMAFWFTLVVGAYVLIAFATQDHNGILNDTTLMLIGVGVGTGLGAAAIQVQKREHALRKLRMLRPQVEALNADPSIRRPELEMAVADLKGQLGKSEKKGFWKDLIYDDTGPSFHRFQMVAWTLVLGAVFIRYVVLYCAMPTFDTTLLALLGISGGTYLGFKIPERQS